MYFCLQELKRELQCHQLQLQIADLQQHIEHMGHLISVQDQENTHTHKYESKLRAFAPGFMIFKLSHPESESVCGEPHCLLYALECSFYISSLCYSDSFEICNVNASICIIHLYHTSSPPVLSGWWTPCCPPAVDSTWRWRPRALPQMTLRGRSWSAWCIGRGVWSGQTRRKLRKGMMVV